MSRAPTHSYDELDQDVGLLDHILFATIEELSNEAGLALVSELRDEAISLRAGGADRDHFAGRFRDLHLGELTLVARAFTNWFHLVNAAEEQHRIRVLRRRDRADHLVVESIAAGFAELRRAGVSAAEMRQLLDRLFIMPVLTAHPTEARRRTVLDHLGVIASLLDELDRTTRGARARSGTIDRLRQAVAGLYGTEESRATKVSPVDEIDSVLAVFERTLLDATPAIYREFENNLAACFPGEAFEVPPFFRWGTWIGGDRDGNPNVTAQVTRTALERHRALILRRYLADVKALIDVLSISSRRAPRPEGLERLWLSIEEDRLRLPDVAARANRYTVNEPWREKLWYIRARLQATLHRSDHAYADAAGYRDDLVVLSESLVASGYGRLAQEELKDAVRRAQVFGFHLASLDLRQHAEVHEAAVHEILARGGVDGYGRMGESERVATLAGLLERADLGPPVRRSDHSPATREILTTLDMVGRARREMGPESCERYVISFTSAVSDLLEVLFLVRAARLSPAELRPVPLLEQLEDLDNGPQIAERMLDLAPIRAALGGELEVMIGYSDAGKQVGFFASAVALFRAQEGLARVAERRGVALTIFHGRGGAIGRGGGPASRAIRGQPPAALRGRLRVTEQGETVTARYGRAEIARRDLEQMVSAVLVAAVAERNGASPEKQQQRDVLLDRAAEAARGAYAELLADRDRLARYAVQSTPLIQVSYLPIGSRPASRKPGFAVQDLRAIPWVFSWDQSRHGLPGWFGLGAALDFMIGEAGLAPVQTLRGEWPMFAALIDNAELALTRSDMDVAEHYSRLADRDARNIFDLIRAEHDRTIGRVLEVVGSDELLANRPHLVRSVKQRNPLIDVLSHAQIELLRRLAGAESEGERDAIYATLFITINGIAAGLQTAG